MSLFYFFISHIFPAHLYWSQFCVNLSKHKPAIPTYPVLFWHDSISTNLFYFIFSSLFNFIILILFSVVFTQACQPMPRYATCTTGKVFNSLQKVPFNVQGLGIITPTHSLSPGIRAFCEYRKKRGFLNRYPRTTVWEGGGREGRMNLFPSSEATILDEQIVRMDRKWLISSDRCQIWQIRAWGHGQFFLESCQFWPLTDGPVRFRSFSHQIDSSDRHLMDILLGILSVLTDLTTLTDGPVRFRRFSHQIDSSDWHLMDRFQSLVTHGTT